VILKGQEMGGRYTEGINLITNARTGRPDVAHYLKTVAARAGVRTHWQYFHILYNNHNSV
jgi:hypothetical protein